MIARTRPVLIALLALATASAVDAAQAYPVRPVRLVVPYPAGGGADNIIARMIGMKLTESWGQQVVIDNRAGAAGIIGTEIAAKAAPDGYTVLFAASNNAIMEGMEGKRPYDLFRDLAPVTMVATAPNILVVNPGVNAKTTKELIAVARGRASPLHYASNGNGSSSHLSAELFNQMAGLKMVHVPYKGGPPGVTATIAGEVQLMFSAILHVLPHTKSGKLRALGVTASKRSQAAPDVATVAEQGLPGYESVQWWMVMVPSATARPLSDTLNGEVGKVLALPDIRERFASQGAEPLASTQDDARKYLKTEVAKWSRIVREIGLKMQ